MASIAIFVSLQSACSSHFTKKQQNQARPARSVGSKRVTHAVTLNVEGQNKGLNIAEQQEKSPFHTEDSKNYDHKSEQDSKTESSAPKFMDYRLKKGTWDLNMFIKDGRMDWDCLIEAEAKRRKFLELYPEASTNEEPVLFRSSIIPWWAWLKRSYLPEAELLNGLDMVGQTGNLICKAGLFLTVIGIIFLRRTDDFQNLRNQADEATLYDNCRRHGKNSLKEALVRQ